MDLKKLSDAQLVNALRSLTGTERETTLAILYHLIELEDRALFREAGYSSLFDYCHRALNYSEGAAGRRVAGARCLREHPDLAEFFLAGKVNLSTIAAAAASLKAKGTKVEEIVGKSRREVEFLVTPPAERKPRERIRPVVVKAPSAALVPEAPREERYEIKFSVTKEVFEEFEQVRNELSNSLGKDLSVEAVFAKLLKIHAAKQRKARQPKARTRRIPLSVKREVGRRDKHQCAYVAPDGTRCTEKRHLQIDHIMPFSTGGTNDPENLRLLCPAHNRLEAEHAFTPGFIRAREAYRRKWMLRNRADA